MTWQFKDPDARLDYQIDWSDALASDTIASSQWTVPAGITVSSEVFGPTSATIWLEGGTDGTRYDLQNRITTIDGRIFDRSIALFVREEQVAARLDASIGAETSDSYVTDVEYLDYALKRGWVVNTGQEANLRAAALYLDTMYKWKGYKTTQAQAMEWPREIDGYIEGYEILSGEIPQPLQDAQCEMAYLIAQGATPFATLAGGAVKSERDKVDVIETQREYATTRDRPAYPVVDALVAPFAHGKIGQWGLSVGLKRG